MTGKVQAEKVPTEGLFTVNRLVPYEDGDDISMASCGCGCHGSVSVSVVLEEQGIDETSVFVLE